MNSLKSTTTGIDVPIQKMQIFLYNKLKALWKLDDNTLQAYGRAYKNTNDKGVIPEVFVSDTPQTNNTVYKAAYGENGFDETTTFAQYFFIADGVTKYSLGQEIDKVSIIFITNLEKIKPTLGHRGDEEVRVDLDRFFIEARYRFLLTGTETGYSNVFKGFTGLLNQDGQIYRDRQPFFLLKVNFDVTYDPTAIDCL